jgi:ABC-type thiamine transport system ATPase subunit
VALLGKSGSGKSTMLRCMSGLIAPSAGTVSYRGTVLNGANPGVAMVFQSFALMPWLTVQQNVELAMQAREVPEAERPAKALHAIDLIGLDGFESAYPKELSGGMRQRVGFARALAEAGREFVAADINASKTLFGKLAAERAPLIKAIVKGLQATNDGTLREGFFLDLLRRGFTDDEARQQLDIAIDWGRYGELFEYDAETGELVLGSDLAKVRA